MATKTIKKPRASRRPAAELTAEERKKRTKADLAAGKLGPSVKALDVDWENATPFYFALRTFIGSLHAAREKAGLTLAAVAERTGLAAETLCRLEAGSITNPTYQTLAKYAVAVGMKKLRIEGE